MFTLALTYVDSIRKGLANRDEDVSAQEIYNLACTLGPTSGSLEVNEVGNPGISIRSVRAHIVGKLRCMLISMQLDSGLFVVKQRSC